MSKHVDINQLLKDLNEAHSRAVMDYRKATGFEGYTGDVFTIYSRAAKAIKQLQKGEVK